MFERPAFTYANTYSKAPLEICFMYLRNRKDCCIFETSCIICVLFSTKFSLSLQIHFSQTMRWILSTLLCRMRVKDDVPGGEPIQTVLDIQVSASGHIMTQPLKTVKWQMLQMLVSRSSTSVWIKSLTASYCFMMMPAAAYATGYTRTTGMHRDWK